MAYCPSSIRGATHRSPLRLRTTITRTRPAHLSQVRSLWWWSRSSYSDLDEGQEERFTRSQRIMRHRYAKMVRRQAMWDRQPTANLWSWHKSGKSYDQQPQNVQRLSTSGSSTTRKQEKAEEPTKADPIISFHKDLDSFRRAVDRAMQRDPYGTLFGRRISSPTSTNNMSWTSFSGWFADPKDIKESPTVDCHASQPMDSSPSARKSKASTEDTGNYSINFTSSPTTSSTASSVSYVYDPISGRKIPEATSRPTTRQQTETSRFSSNAAASQAQESRPTSIFETLFGENAVDIPVKIFEPKVYGFGASEESPKDTSSSTRPVKSKSGFENSRKREFLALKAVTLGSTIDTTAEFGGRYNDPTVPPDTTSLQKTDAPEDAPLFSGTTYEGRAATILNNSQRSTWLQKEGFGQAVDPSSGSTTFSHSRAEKIQPALDRAQSKTATKSDLLQPSLYRNSKTKGQDLPTSQFKSTASWHAKVDAAEKAEDIDLLRTRDVRASMKHKSGQTKQDVEIQKKQIREDLEKAFAAKEAQADDIAKPRLPSGFDHLRKHMESNPDGIVAKTMKSVGTFNESLQKYLRTNEEPKQTSKVKEEQPVIEAFTTAAPATKPQPFGDSPMSTVTKDKPHPLSQATVKEGVPRHTAIENHVSKFEPRYVDLLFQMKNIRRELHDSKLQLRYLRFSLERIPWSELEAERLAEYARSCLIEEDVSAAGFDEPIFNASRKNAASTQPPSTVSQAEPEVISKRDTEPKGLDEPVISHQPKSDSRAIGNAEEKAASPSRIEPPVFTPAESAVWNDEQPPPLAELRVAGTKDFTSPFVMLISNGKNGIRAVPAPNLPHLAGRKKINPFELLASLQQDKAAQFLAYFPRLQEAGYELVNGDASKLTFRRLSTNDGEAAATAVSTPDQKAATVLEEIPAEIEPPGPYTPIAPPSAASLLFDRRPKSQPPIRRVEEVFSGTTTAPARPIEPTGKVATAPPPSYHYETEDHEPGLSGKFVRAFRRVTLMVLALAGGAYMIGFVSEGVGAQTQAQRGLTGEAGGPRKRIVLPVEGGENWRRGTRPGIYSTESSR